MSRTWWYANSAGKLAAPYQKHQLGVPRLPIPTLEESCTRYLRAAQPLQSSADHAKTKQVVADFCKPGGEGELLQKELKRTDASLPAQSSYVESLWYRLAYLGGRDPVTIGSNPGIVLAPPTDPMQRDPLWRAASLLAACMAWKRELDEGTLPPMFAGKTPLCVSMLPSVFGCSRRPEAGCDRIQAAPHATHAALSWRGAWFSLPLVEPRTDALLTPEQLLGALQSLPHAAAGAPDGGESALSALTAANRDQWAAARAELTAASPLNASSLAAIDSALCVLVLDGDAPQGASALARAMLCGDAAKRWYDKLTWVVFANGVAGVNFEHSPVDGAQLIFTVEDLARRIANAPPRPAAPPPPAAEAAPLLLRWSVPVPLALRIERARADAAAAAARLECEATMLRCVSLDWARQQRLSLDTLVQMALQMGYRAVRGRLDSTYEACSTNNFVCGRTETIRSVTPQSVALCEALARGQADVPAQLSLLQAALDAHRTTVRACQAAHGHERHLLALRFQAVDLGRPTPALFCDGGYAAVGNSVLSTSGLRSPALELFCFGPVVETGMGFGYVLKPDGVLLSVTSWRGKGPPAAEVSAAVEAALRQLRTLVEQRSPPPPRSKL